jgi:pilus assembly protein FimV
MVQSEPPPDTQLESLPQLAAQAESAEQPTVQVEQPAPQAEPAQPVPAQPAAETQSKKADPKSSAQPQTYQVKKGDTLSKIAGRAKPEGVSLDQMLVALQRANPNAFVGKNINRLRVGQILSLPDAETAGGINDTQAKGIVIAQAADFSSYQKKLAARVAAAAAQKSDEAKQSATGKITTKVEEQSTAANEAKDKLKLSKSGAVSEDASKGGSIAAGAENKIANDKALADANARVKELEKNVSDLAKILEIKNRELAEKQKQALAAKTDTKPAAPAPAAPVAAAPAAPKPAAAPAPQPALAKAATQPAASAPATVPPPAAQKANAQPPAKEEKPRASPLKPKAAPAAPPEKGFIDELLDNPLLLSSLAAVLAVLAALGIYGFRRKRNREEFQDSNMLTDSNLKTNSLFGSTGGQSVDTNNSVFNSNFAPSASQLDANEVDPVAEADVYIAYGRDAQAEEILKEALRTQPERNAVRVKLLEIYANRKDVRAFEITASELYSMTKGAGDDWRQAASLGIGIDPKNPLYAGGKPAQGAVAKIAAPKSPPAASLLDELNFDALLNTTRSSNTSSENSNPFQSNLASADDTAHAVEVKPKKAAAPVAAPAPVAPMIPVAPPRAAPSAPAAPAVPVSAGLDFDFDLTTLGVKEVQLPPAAPPPKPASVPDLMDLDFLEDSHTAKKPHENNAPAAHAPEIAVDDFALDMHAFSLPQVPAAAHASAPAPNVVDFDLSAISLDLNSVDSKPAALQDTHAASNDAQSNVAEMATKLDLALAYQEIGDKDGARELLDEVVKGGTAEQTEKARSMLQKIA